ncbi:hypothetical protein CBS101457_003279 [Exobasidium rhododendri]|nr:hypothetical protein CBS101457_003279 [Exobasidium rhododendri]
MHVGKATAAAAAPTVRKVDDYVVKSAARQRRQLPSSSTVGLDSMGYDDGLYNPVKASVSAVDEAGQIYSSLDASSLIVEDLDTATAAIVSSTSSSIMMTPAMSETTLASVAGTSSSAASPTIVLPTSESVTESNGGMHFHITYLIPLFVVVGLVLLLAVGGKIWGRITYSKERALRRRTRQERQLIREQKEQRIEEIRRQWEQNGWGENVSFDASFEKQRIISSERRNDSDDLETESEDEFKGPLQYIGIHLAGVEKGRSVPPSSRIEQSRYSVKVKANHWLRVKLRRKYQQGNNAEPESTPVVPPVDLGTPDNVGDDPWMRATLRGTWDRVKSRITGNVGWGYDGSTPNVQQRRQMIAGASSRNLWTRMPISSNALSHTPSGLLLPPQLESEGALIIEPRSALRKSKVPVSSRRQQGEGDCDSPPALKAPPNSIKVLSSSASKTALNSVKDIFTSFRGKSSYSLADGAEREEHERLQGELGEREEKKVNDYAYTGHVHSDGTKCSLDEPQYLPPSSVVGKKYTLVDEEVAVDESDSPLCSTPRHAPPSILSFRQPSSLGDSPAIRARTLSSRKEDLDTDQTLRENDSTSFVQYATHRSTGTVDNDEDEMSDGEGMEVTSPTKRTSRTPSMPSRNAADHGDNAVRRNKSSAAKSAPSHEGPIEVHSRSPIAQPRKKAQRSQSAKSSRSTKYTAAVNFGEEEEDDKKGEGKPKKTFAPAVDSRTLTRTRTRKDGLDKHSVRLGRRGGTARGTWSPKSTLP